MRKGRLRLSTLVDGGRRPSWGLLGVWGHGPFRLFAVRPGGWFRAKPVGPVPPVRHLANQCGLGRAKRTRPCCPHLWTNGLLLQRQAHGECSAVDRPHLWEACFQKLFLAGRHCGKDFFHNCGSPGHLWEGEGPVLGPRHAAMISERRQLLRARRARLA